MFYKKELAETLEELNTSLEGLSSIEVETRQKKYGLNELKEKEGTSVFQLFVDSFKDPLVIILLIAAIVQIFLGELAESLIIFLVLILNSILGVVQTKKAEGSLAALKQLSSPHAKVIRNNQKITVPAKDLVPGDILILEAGDYVPADGRILESQTLKIMEGMLTGESDAVLKEEDVIVLDVPLGDRKNMIYSGSMIVYGRGLAVVTATGMNTEIGKIAGLLEAASAEETPLQKNIEIFSKKLGVWIVILCILIFIIMSIKEFEGQINLVQVMIKSFMFAVAVAVAAIPEALSSIVTIVLAVGTNKMAKKNAIIRKLPAVETLGSTSVICTDKTGTLTQNKMTVVDFYMYGVENGQFNSDIEKGPRHEKIFILASSLANDSTINKEGKEIGDPTEVALISFAMKNNIDFEELREKFTRLSELPFDSDRKIMSTVNKVNGKNYMFSKGAPDVILNRCKYALSNGKETELSQEIKEAYISKNEYFSNKALRVLALAYKKIDQENFIPTLDDENDLVLVGLIAIVDPPRAEVYDAIKEAKEAGIKPIMITGDHKTTAAAIAKEIGLMETGEKAITGQELDAMDENQLDKELESISVYARVSPENKIRIVKAWQKKGKITAMTGDGVNDAPALKQADIGIAMGTGTDVAKDAAAMILVDDNFATIIHAIEIGRSVYANIKKSIYYLFAGNLGAIIAIIFALFAGWDNPFTPLQLLFINLINDSMPAIALGLEAPEKNIMHQSPRNPRESLIPKKSLIAVIFRGTMIGIAVIISQYLGDLAYPGLGEAMAFTTVIFARILQTLPARSESETILSLGLFSNMYVIIAMILCFCIYTISLIPTLRPIFNISEGFGINQIVICFILAFIAMVIMELEKIFFKK